MLNPPMPKEIKKGEEMYWKLFFGETFKATFEVQQQMRERFGKWATDATVGRMYRQLRQKYGDETNPESEWHFSQITPEGKPYDCYRIQRKQTHNVQAELF